MNLKVLIPTKILIDQDVTKVIAEAENGAFCLLPRHIDFLTALVPGILSFTIESGQEIFLAIDEGILVKQGEQVFVSTLQAIRDDHLETLQETVDQKFQVLNEQEKLTRSALAKFEIIIMRHFQQLSC
jgi:F-type H+-transporting ATPase subunit epsilon